MNNNELKEIGIALLKISFLPGSFDKRFSKSIASRISFGIELTEKQTEWMYRIIYKYRRQIPNVYSKYKNHPHCSNKQPQTKKQ